MDKNIGKKLDGRYEITELIGIGGMADVYKATDILENKTVAVKILKNEFLDNEDFIRRFRNESKAIAVLSHPNIVKIFDVGFTERLQFIVMEHIDGITLKEFIEQQGVLKWKDSVHFIVQILRALQHAHDRGIVHRDIKPQNIMLFPDGTIKVMDFGIARFAREEGRTISEKAIGSVHYISPEQARGDVTDEKSDIYSVGVMLYEMLTGQKPFDGDNPVSVALMHMQNDAEPPRIINDSIPEGLEEIVIRAMQKESAKRYQSASEMIKDIDEFKKNPSIVFEYTYISDKTQYYNTNAVSKVAAAAYEANMPKSVPARVNDKSVELVKKSKSAVASRVREKPDYDDYGYDDYDDTEVSKSSYFVVVLTAIAAVVIILVVIFIVYMLKDILDPPKPVMESMPDLLGYNYTEAKGFYAGKFTLVLESQEYSDEFPVGAIISHRPESGRDYIVGKTDVKAVVSRGPRMVPVPNVYGLEASNAENYLKSDGFSVSYKSEFSDEVPKDQVIRTEPARADEVPFGSTIYLIISRGVEEPEFLMPDVVGLPLKGAEASIAERLVIQVQEAGNLAPAGTVLEQSIPARNEQGERTVVKIGTVVILTVSTGELPQVQTNVTFRIPSNLEGTMTFICYINGINVGEERIDNLAYATTVSVPIEGTGVQIVILEALNNKSGKSAKIGEYAVDFTAEPNPMVTEVEFDGNALRDLLRDIQTTTTLYNPFDPYDPYDPWATYDTETEITADDDFDEDWWGQYGY